MPCRSIALFLVALVAALAGCGEGGPTRAEYAAAVKDTVITGSKRVKPAQCRQLYTQDFLEETAFGREGEAAVQVCEEVAEKELGLPAREVLVSNVRIGDGAATAEATFVGGTYDDQTVLYSVLLQEGRWKIHRMVKFVEFNRARLISGLKREMHDFKKLGFEAEMVGCLGNHIEKLGDEGLQDMALFHNAGTLPGFIEDCVRQAEGTQEL